MCRKKAGMDRSQEHACSGSYWMICSNKQEETAGKKMEDFGDRGIYLWEVVKEFLLLLSRFSRVRLCATPWTAAHQAPPSMGFSRQEYWSGVPLPSPTDKARTPPKRCYQHPELPHLYFVADSATSSHFSVGARGRQLLFFLLPFDVLLVSPDRT